MPKKLRDATATSSNEDFVIVAGYDKCIFIYPKEEWVKQEEKLRNLQVDFEEHRYYEREFFSNSEDVRMDRAGRLTISSQLLKHAQIKPKEEIWILGVLSRIEVWNPEIYQKYKERFKQTKEQLGEKIFKSETM